MKWLDIDPETISYVATIVLGVLATFLGDRWRKAKDKFNQGQQTTLKFALAIKELTEAIEDDRITQEEAVRIVEAWKQVINEAGSILNTDDTKNKKTIKKTPINRITDLENKIDKTETLEEKIDLLIKRLDK